MRPRTAPPGAPLDAAAAGGHDPVGRLVTVAHGTRDAAGNRVAAELTAAAGARLGVPAQVSYVELSAPTFHSVMAATVEPTVVVPLLLSTGYHVRHDLPEAVAACAAPVTMAGPLGPDPLIAAAQVDRLRAAGADPEQPVVLVAAGSNDPQATADLEGAVDALDRIWGGEVRLAVLAGMGPRVEEVVRPGDAVTPYLLAPGFFATRAARLAREAGATVVADPIGVHPLVVDLLCRRATDPTG